MTSYGECLWTCFGGIPVGSAVTQQQKQVSPSWPACVSLLILLRIASGERTEPHAINTIAQSLHMQTVFIGLMVLKSHPYVRLRFHGLLVRVPESDSKFTAFYRLEQALTTWAF